MKKNEGYEFKLLDPQTVKIERELLSKLLFPGYGPLFNPPDLLNPDNTNLMIMAARFRDKTVGLVIGEKITAFESVLQIKSLFVDESHRDKNLPEKMLKLLVDTFYEEGGRTVQAIYPEEKIFIEEWEKAFISLKWRGKRLAVFECSFKDVRRFNPPWFDKPYILPKEFEIFLWENLTEEEKRKIEVAHAQGIIPNETYPFAKGISFEPTASFGLRINDTVIGWLLTCKLNPQTLSYHQLYCDPVYRKQGPIIFLLIKAIRHQQQSPIRQAIFRVNIIQLPTLHWLKFIKRRIAPYADRVTPYYLAWKNL